MLIGYNAGVPRFSLARQVFAVTLFGAGIGTAIRLKLGFDSSDFWLNNYKPGLTTTANELMKPLHDRMSVILSPTHYDAWLNPETTDPAKLAYLLEPFPAEEMTAVPVKPVVNNARNEGPQCNEGVKT